MRWINVFRLALPTHGNYANENQKKGSIVYGKSKFNLYLWVEHNKELVQLMLATDHL